MEGIFRPSVDGHFGRSGRRIMIKFDAAMTIKKERKKDGDGLWEMCKGDL